MGGVPSVGVFLRDPSSYLWKFQQLVMNNNEERGAYSIKKSKKHACICIKVIKGRAFARFLISCSLPILKTDEKIDNVMG